MPRMKCLGILEPAFYMYFRNSEKERERERERKTASTSYQKQQQAVTVLFFFPLSLSLAFSLFLKETAGLLKNSKWKLLTPSLEAVKTM